MKSNFKKVFTILIFTLLVASCGKEAEIKNTEKTDDEKLYSAKITAVVDGDTVKVQFEKEVPEDCSKKETIRLIGVNTPELNLYKDEAAEYFAKEAYEYTNRYYREVVNIQFDNVSALRDRYDRILAYVWLCNSTMLNKNLIEDGYGRYYNAFQFNENYMNEFLSAEIQAVQQKKGMWGGQND